MQFAYTTKRFTQAILLQMRLKLSKYRGDDEDA